MASLSAIRDGLAARLATISGLRTHDTVPDSVSPPAAIVTVARGTFLTFDSSMSRGSDDIMMLITLVVGRVSERAAQDKLDGYLAGSGATSIKAAIEGDVTLGGVANYAVVTEARDYGIATIAGIDYLGCELVVEVKVM